jgi:NAD(P)-dependent dehydrogenase (short-subunit alcohol dehydrogenase family)
MAGNESGAVVVTGASTGIGRATALLLDRKGYQVFAGVRKQADSDELSRAGSDRLSPIAIDVTEADSIDAARQEVNAAAGEDGLVGLVNNAGVGGGGPIEFMQIEDLRNTLEVNLVGQVAVTQAFLPLIRKAEGTVVFISSIGGRIPLPFLSPYNASKFGIEAIGDSLRREVSPWGIDVVIVEPGSIATEIWGKAAETMSDRVAAMPEDARRLYGPQLAGFGKSFVEGSGGRGIPPENVGEVVHKAISSDRPRTRYLVGADAKVGARLKGALPDRTFDRMLRRRLNQPSDLRRSSPG